MLKLLYHRVVPVRLREWLYGRVHPEARLEAKFFERTRGAVRQYITRAAREGWLPGLVLEVGSGLETFNQEVFRQFSPQTRLLRSEINGSGTYDLYCDVTALGFRSASLDGVISSEVLEHVPDYRQALNEIARVLRPGGRLLLTSPFLYPIHGRSDYWRFTPLALEHLLHEHYEIVDITLFQLQAGTRSFPVDIGVLATRK